MTPQEMRVLFDYNAWANHRALEAACRRRGWRFAREGFADRAMRGGRLVPRGEPGALIADPAAAAENARRLFAAVDTICVHGDTRNAATSLKIIRDELKNQNVEVTSIRSIM